MQVTGYGKQTEWRVSIVTTLTTKASSSVPFPPSYHTYTLTSLNRDSAYQLEVIYAQIGGTKLKLWVKLFFPRCELVTGMAGLHFHPPTHSSQVQVCQS